MPYNFTCSERNFNTHKHIHLYKCVSVTGVHFNYSTWLLYGFDVIFANFQRAVSKELSSMRNEQPLNFISFRVIIRSTFLIIALARQSLTCDKILEEHEENLAIKLRAKGLAAKANEITTNCSNLIYSGCFGGNAWLTVATTKQRIKGTLTEIGILCVCSVRLCCCRNSFFFCSFDVVIPIEPQKVQHFLDSKFQFGFSFH